LKCIIALFFELVKLSKNTPNPYFGQAEPLSESGELNGVSVKKIQICFSKKEKDVFLFLCF